MSSTDAGLIVLQYTKVVSVHDAVHADHLPSNTNVPLVLGA